MKKRWLGIMGAILLSAAVGGLAGAEESRAKTAETVWNKRKTITVTNGEFEFYAYLSSEGDQSWIYKVTGKQNETEKPEKLVFPEKINGAPVTKVGSATTDDFTKSIFDVWVEHAHDGDGYTPLLEKISEMTLPDTVTEIVNSAFSGMHALTSVKIPDKVEVLPGSVFYGSKNLKKLQLPKNLKKIDVYSGFDDCPKLSVITLSQKSPNFSVKNKMLLSKDKKKLVWVLPAKKKVSVPDTVEEIGENAFLRSQVTEVKLGKNVSILPSMCLNSKKVKKITLDKKNKSLAKDGQCIYHREDNSFAVGIAKNKKLVISSKITKITEDYSICGVRLSKAQGGAGLLKRLDIPASVTQLGANWIRPFDADKVYFHNPTPPQLSKKGKDRWQAQLPVYCKIYVPKGSLRAYKAWYKEKKLAYAIDEEYWHTF